MKARYLTFYSYIGTHFRSSEKIWLKDGKCYPDPESVQGLLEIALRKLKPLNYPSVTLSSRTDGGVHALNTSCHFDLERYGTKIYDPDNITYSLNKYFYKTDTSIYIRRCCRVADDFSARHKAIRRTYLYRLAVLQKDKTIPENVSIGSYIPVEEWKRCHFIRVPGFDIERFKEGAKYLVGYHDFTTFKKQDKHNETKQNRREIYSIDVRPGQALVADYAGRQGSVFQYWDIEIQGRAFVHNQIRRMVGTLISVAIGKLPPAEIKVMLQVPSKWSWPSFVASTPPHGLYLCNVEYDPRDLFYEHDSDSVANQLKATSDCA